MLLRRWTGVEGSHRTHILQYLYFWARLGTVLLAIRSTDARRASCGWILGWRYDRWTNCDIRNNQNHPNCPPIPNVRSKSCTLSWNGRRYSARPPNKSTTTLYRLAKKSRTNGRGSSENEDINRWYETVDDNATPDDVFWGEMERQILIHGAGNDDLPSPSPPVPIYNINTINQGNTQASAASQSDAVKPVSAKSIEATLSAYNHFACPDNWLDDDLAELMMGDFTNIYSNNGAASYTHQQEAFFRNAPPLDDQLNEWASEDGADDEKWEMPSDEPWDQWADANLKADDDEMKQDLLLLDDDDDGRMRIGPNDRRRQPSEFLFDENLLDDNDEEMERLQRDDERKEEEAYEARLSRLTIRSARLESAKNNPKALAFFQREPDASEGYDRLWVSAIDNVCFKNLVGTFRNYGIQFADNFGDWQDGCIPDGLASIEDIAAYKARQVYSVTGLPCIASRTSFEVEPIPDLSGIGSNAPSRSAAAIFSNPRVTSGYRFNDIGMHVDYICNALRPLSEPDRVTRFKTCLCYYDGTMEIFDYGTCDVDIHFANSLRTFIPVAQAINEMLKTLELTFGLVYQKWLKTRITEVLSSGYGSASVKLRDRVLKEGRVLPNDIVDVSAFMDSMVDVNLMDECAKELAQRFVSEKPTKILTVATTGLVIALPMAKHLQVPVVYARKERNVVMADTYIAAYSSKTVGKNRELLVSRSHLDADDRVLIIDDFLSSGSSQEALLRIVSQAGATAVGVGCLLEKVYDSGRQSLSGFDIPIHSLCRIASVQSGVIQLMEEEGFSQMQQEQQKEQLQKQQRQQQ
jgi:xanthine phosphoribosyltransferase